MSKQSAGRGGKREGAGRKPSMGETSTIAAVVPTELRTRLERLAEANGERLSAYVRRMLERGAHEAESQAAAVVEAKPAPKKPAPRKKRPTIRVKSPGSEKK